LILAQISDPHIDGDEASAESLAAGVRAVCALRPSPDAVLVSGDLAETAAPEEYARVRELLAPLEMPVYTLPGNHDDPGALPAPAVYDVAGVRLVLCDSTIPGRDEGRLDVEWVAAQIGDGPAIVAMHHPPFDIGMPALDEISLLGDDRAALAELLASSPQVLRVICGHTHRAAFGTIGGCPAMTCPGIHLTARLEIGALGYEIAREPPGFALHVTVGDDVVSHIQPVT
jgi:3',5'-cyclic AMP phosphodiesterase CpdA